MLDEIPLPYCESRPGYHTDVLKLCRCAACEAYAAARYGPGWSACERYRRAIARMSSYVEVRAWGSKEHVAGELIGPFDPRSCRGFVILGVCESCGADQRSVSYRRGCHPPAYSEVHKLGCVCLEAADEEVQSNRM